MSRPGYGEVIAKARKLARRGATAEMIRERLVVEYPRNTAARVVKRLREAGDLPPRSPANPNLLTVTVGQEVLDMLLHVSLSNDTHRATVARHALARGLRQMMAEDLDVLERRRVGSE